MANNTHYKTISEQAFRRYILWVLELLDAKSFKLVGKRYEVSELTVRSAFYQVRHWMVQAGLDGGIPPLAELVANKAVYQQKLGQLYEKRFGHAMAVPKLASAAAPAPTSTKDELTASDALLNVAAEIESGVLGDVQGIVVFAVTAEQVHSSAFGNVTPAALIERLAPKPAAKLFKVQA